MVSDAFVNCPSYFIAHSVSSAGQRAYKMVFNAGSQVHAATAPFLFSLDYAGAEPPLFSTTWLLKFPVTPGANVTTTNIMKDWFLSFAIYLDPGRYSWSGVKKPDWEMYHSDGNRNARVMSVNYTEVGMVDDRYFDQTKQCEFLWKNGAIVQNKR